MPPIPSLHPSALARRRIPLLSIGVALTAMLVAAIAIGNGNGSGDDGSDPNQVEAVAGDAPATTGPDELAEEADDPAEAALDQRIGLPAADPDPDDPAAEAGPEPEADPESISDGATSDETAPETTGTPASTEAPPPAFASRIYPIDDEMASLMIGRSWHDGCPTPLTDLRVVEVTYIDDAGSARTGQLIVHHEVADDVVSVFETLFEDRFPISAMRPVAHFGGDDLSSMQANNTSGFNCRRVGGSDRWSEHAFGRAIDINPLVNPWVRGNLVDPPEAAPYVDRSRPVPGGIYPGDVVTQAFAAIGWGWGGDWSSSLDYQHFSQNGR